MNSGYDFERLRKELADIIKESQIKIGYTDTSIGLYYPLGSLNRVLGADCDALEMLSVMERFGEYTKPTLGKISVSAEGERFCLRIPPEGAAYVNSLPEESGFLREFIDLMRMHTGVTIERILEVFGRYSDCVKCVPIEDNGEFDYLIYFADGRPDDHRYCIELEMGHAVYHRFTAEDFEDLGFEIGSEEE